jgi:hypothetical protein
MRVFVETGSDNPAVMMTVNAVSEAQKVDFPIAIGGTRADDGRKGVLLYVRWQEAPAFNESVTFTVWQNGATQYGPAEHLPEDGFDQARPTESIVQGPL